MDLNLTRVEAVVGAGPDVVAVNVHHGAEAIAAHVDGRAHVSHEVEQALGTAGAVAQLAGWLDGRAVLVVNGDAWTSTALHPLIEGWDGTRMRVAVVGDEPLAAGRPVAGALLPPAEIARLRAEPAGLWGTLWRPALEEGRLDTVAVHGLFVDCGTPADYLAANLQASGGAPVVGEGAVVEGALTRAVVWDGARVEPGEVLVDAIRTDHERITVLVRTPQSRSSAR